MRIQITFICVQAVEIMYLKIHCTEDDCNYFKYKQILNSLFFPS